MGLLHGGVGAPSSYMPRNFLVMAATLVLSQ